jgi:cholesterol oxidase
MTDPQTFDYVIVGSGFGGSVSALRLAEKGYSVAVIEQGRRFTTSTLPTSTWKVRDYLWAPALRMFGIFSLTLFKDIVIFHGAGVGGGSLVYANTHLEPLDAFYNDPKWAHLGDWKKELAPFYARARRMLGSVEPPAIFETDKALREVLTDMGTGDSFKKHTVGIYFGQPGENATDPYFDGEGPARTGCTFCGACMVGCTVGAKNTLDRNYLFLAEKRGATVIPETRVLDIHPNADTNADYRYTLSTSRTTTWLPSRGTIRARNVVLSAGVLGTVGLLHRCRANGSLPRLSPTLGTFVRTNSESIQGVFDTEKPIGGGVAISSGGFTPDGTHIEMVRYGDKADSMSMLATVHTAGGALPRQLYFLAAFFKNPFAAVRRWIWPFGWSRHAGIVLAMQATDNSMQLKYRRKWYWPFSRQLDSDWGDRQPPPSWLPEAHEVTRRLATKLGGKPGSVLPEVVLNATTTAHILGGCPIGEDEQSGVIDPQHRVFGHPGMLVVDGSAIPANLGVNPSLTITAMAERAMSFIPTKNAASTAPANQLPAAADSP